MPRFVILQHEHPRGLHWDLMLEAGEVLKTWALTEPPDAPLAAAEALPDHRREYLDYEGPISGGRGQVGRWDAGQYVLESCSDDRWVVALAGRRLAGRVILTRQSEPPRRWEYRREVETH